MSLCGFIFDIVVVRVDAPNTKVEDPKLLSVEAVFNNNSLKLSSSSINVVEFPPDHGLEFQSTPEELRSNLQTSPLHLKVKYGSETIGSGEMNWAECVYNRINSSMTEVTHFDEIDLEGEDMERKLGGHAAVMVRLKCKCKEESISDDLFDCMKPAAGTSLRADLHKVIDPHDVLFIVSDPNKDDTCGSSMTAAGAMHQYSPSAGPPMALDLSPYRNLNGRLIQTPDVLNTCHNPDCCELKNISQQYQELIDSLTCSKVKDRSCRANRHVDECPHRKKFSSDESSSDISTSDLDIGKFCYASRHDNENTFGGERLIPVCPPPVEEPCLQQTIFKTPRNCPVCKNDISWLPKLANCPKCGYKPVPVVKEKPYDESMTAADILKEYTDFPTNPTDNQKTVESVEECRCSCTIGKTCANCRVRKMCEDILPTAEAGKPRNRSQRGTSGAAASSQSSTEDDDRPHLNRVFSEIKDLFNVPEKVEKKMKENPKCEALLFSGPKAKESQPKHSDEQKQHPEAKGKGKYKEGLKSEDFKKLREHGYFAKDSAKSSEQGPCKKLRKRKDRNAMRKKRICCYPKPKVSEAEEVMTRTAAKHRACLNVHKNVPRNMGWLWNGPGVNFGPGWRPGAIRKPIKELMRYFLRDFPTDTVVISRYGRARREKKKEEDEEQLVQKPTMHICKKGDEIWITLRPLKDSQALAHCADPYMKMKPIQFKITKNPIAVETSRIKQFLKDIGFKKCTCHQPVSQCCCRSYISKKRLEYQLCKECEKRGIHNCADSLVLSDTTDSEVEYDFGVTPPAGVIQPTRGKKPDLVNQGTQYVEGDWNTPPLFPKPPSRYMKSFNCATGLRYYGGEYGFGPGGMAGGGWGGGFGPGGRGGWGPGGGFGGRGGFGPGGRGGFGPGGRGGFGPGGRGGFGPGGRGGFGPGGWGPGGPGGPGGFGPGGGMFYPDGTQIPTEGPYSYGNRDGKFGKETSVGEDLYRDKRLKSRPLAICNPCCNPCACSVPTCFNPC